MVLNFVFNKNDLYKTLDYWFRDKLSFYYLKKNLGIVSPLRFLYDCSRKFLLLLYFINLSNFIVWLPLLLEILGNVYIVTVCFSGCDVITFGMNLTFLIKQFFYLTKKSRGKCWERKKNIWWKKIFWSFLMGFQLPKVFSELRVRFSGP